ncbi:hypothetical protein LY90DRAFT_504101 [Neocallimastix californiae]|uniref:Uncharacterized protein n=1 Tax=Neocallimastix californiae TaxID=1754190 RepID=A0A1Y2EGV4_9FUNG|nr:hypothetical protein LY90DRAFT_504101 [Neocallimastix californiae]|eukprot:ORY70534.1 hypothetical protein LY90DRAFT_504101 [Neocallimastix californiae]
MVEDYTLHKYIYNDDYVNLFLFLQQPNIHNIINKKDTHGNTALQLALMLDRRNCAQKLIDSGADSSIRNGFGWSCLDEAYIIGDIDLIEKLIIQKWMNAVKKCLGPGGYLEQLNKNLPCFQAQIAVSFRSPVPLLAKICPRDLITIYKKGSKFRVDFHITGLDKRSIPKFLKGNMSVIVNVLPNEEFPVIQFLDHDKKTFQEIFPNIPSWSLYDFVSQYSNASSIISFDLNLRDITVKKKAKKLFSKSNSVQLKSRNVKADVYKLSNIILTTQERLNEKFIGDRPSAIVRTKIIHKKKVQNSPKESSTLTSSKTSSNDGSYDSDNMESDDEGYDSSFTDDDSTKDSDSKEQSQSSSILESLTNDKNQIPLNKQTKEQITHMLITGKDENDKPLQKKDIEFLNTHIEQYLEDIDNESIDAMMLEIPKNAGGAPSIVSIKSNSTNTLIETKSVDSFNTSKFVSHNTIMATSNNIRKSNSSGKTQTEKYNNNNNTLSSLVNSNPNIERIREVVVEPQNKYWDKQEMTFQDYINTKTSTKGSLHMGRKLNVEYDQHIYKQKVKFFMCKCDKDYPVSLSQFAPLIEYLLSFTVNNQEEESNVKSYVDRIINSLSGKDHFPGKIEIPIMATVFAKLKFKNIHTDESKIPDDLFELPKNYQPNDYYNNIINE